MNLIILLLMNLLVIESKTLFMFYNSLVGINHVNIGKYSYRESGVMTGQEGYIYFENVKPYLVNFNGGYIDYMDMSDMNRIKSDKKYKTSVFYSGQTKEIDSIVIMGQGNIINAFHMNFECLGQVDYSIELYKNGDLIHSVDLVRPYISWFLHDFNDFNEYETVYTLLLRNRGDILINCLECLDGYINSYFWNIFLEDKEELKTNISNIEEEDINIGIGNDIIYHISYI